MGRKANNSENPSPLIEEWLSDDNLALIAGWIRDGFTLNDVANKIGTNINTLMLWRKKYPEFDDAFKRGREMVDYLVENALLKSALGYQTKEVKVTTTMRRGKVVETIKETLEKEQSPNVTAIQMWLYNRQRDKWKNMNNAKNVFDDMEEDSSIEITVKRAEKRQDEFSEAEAPFGDREITVRKRSKAETEEVRKAKRMEQEKQNKNYEYEDDEEE